jgi:hypothetical protein
MRRKEPEPLKRVTVFYDRQQPYTNNTRYDNVIKVIRHTHEVEIQRVGGSSIFLETYNLLRYEVDIQ